MKDKKSKIALRSRITVAWAAEPSQESIRAAQKIISMNLAKIAGKKANQPQ